MMRTILLLLSLSVQVGAVAAAEESWGDLVARAHIAVSVGDQGTAGVAISLLRAADPHSPVPDYLSARLAERTVDWDDARARYRTLLTQPQLRMDEEWIRLISGRWVRAQRSADAHWVRRLASQSVDTLRIGRCLVLPPELLLLAPTPGLSATDLNALSAAMSAWVVMALRQNGLATPIGLQATALLLRSSGLRPGGGRLAADIRPAAEGAMPPVTTTMGIAHRLTDLAPAGPPPWNPDGSRPPHYLSGEPRAKWTFEIEQALIHFQREHRLAPTGIPDAETRQALERAYRQAQGRLHIPLSPQTRSDPALAVARLAGAEAILTGTLEPLPDGGIVWNVVWVSVADGSLLSSPLQGVLVPDAFAASWTHLIRQTLVGSPFCARSAACDDLSLLPAPSQVGAVLYGQALSALAAGDDQVAARGFAQAAGAGAGEGARWYARAWERTESRLDLLERQLIEREILGPVTVPTRFLERQGDGLAGGLWRMMPAIRRTQIDPHRESALHALPEGGWLQIDGALE